MRVRTIAFLVTAIAAVSMLAYGIFRGELGKVLFNAATL